MKNEKHHNGKRFFNPTHPGKQKSFLQGLTMWLTTKRALWPTYVENTATPQLNLSIETNQVSVTFVNHVTFLIQLPGLNILTDPVWAQRASPFSFLGPKRARDPGIAFADLPKIDLILVSHNHYDHLDKHTLKKLNQKFQPRIFVPIGDAKLLHSIGCKNVQECDWWDKHVINSEVKIHFTPTQHWSSRGIFDQYKSLWGSYIIEYNGKKIFFGGDAGYSRFYSDIYNNFGAIDLAFLGVGSYEPRWFMETMHKNPDEAVRAHLDLHSKQSIAMHFGTFQLSAEGIQQPIIDLQAAKIKHSVMEQDFTVLQEGQTRVFNL